MQSGYILLNDYVLDSFFGCSYQQRRQWHHGSFESYYAMFYLQFVNTLLAMNKYYHVIANGIYRKKEIYFLD